MAVGRAGNAQTRLRRSTRPWPTSWGRPTGPVALDRADELVALDELVAALGISRDSVAIRGPVAGGGQLPETLARSPDELIASLLHISLIAYPLVHERGFCRSAQRTARLT